MLKTLIKMQFSALASQTIRKTRKGRATNKTSGGKVALYSILLLICFGYFSVMFGGIFYLIESFLAGTEQSWAMPALASFLTMILCFVGTIFTTQSFLFNSKDNDLLISMPIPPKMILLSRIATLAILNYFLAFLIFFPAEIVWIMINGFGLETVVIFLLFILIPLAAMALTLVIGWLIALISSRMKNKNIITMILSLAAFILYFVLCFNLGEYMVKVEENPSIVSSFISEYLGFFVIMGKAVANLDIISLLITAAVCIIPFAIVYFILSKSFLKIVTGKKSAKKAVYRKKEMKSQSVSTALIKKEFKRFFTSTTYFLNSFMGVIFIILISAALFTNVQNIKEAVYGISEMFFLKASAQEIIGFFGVGIITLISAFNIPTGVCISLEGKTLWILQSMPLKAKDVLLAKMRAAVIATAVPNLIFAIIISVIYSLDYISIISLLIVAFAMPVFSCCIGIIINMLMPRFDWINETICVKQSGSSIISLLSMMLISILIVVGGGFTAVKISVISGMMFVVGFIIAFAVSSYIIIRSCFENRFKDLG